MNRNYFNIVLALGWVVEKLSRFDKVPELESRAEEDEHYSRQLTRDIKVLQDVEGTPVYRDIMKDVIKNPLKCAYNDIQHLKRIKSNLVSNNSLKEHEEYVKMLSLKYKIPLE